MSEECIATLARAINLQQLNTVLLSNCCFLIMLAITVLNISSNSLIMMMPVGHLYVPAL